MKVEVIRTTGEREWHELGKDWLGEIRRLIGAHTLDMVTLKDRVHVMCVDDAGYEYEVIDHGLQPDPKRPGQKLDFVIEHRVTKALKPVNAEATRLYHEARGAREHQIVGDVAIVDDREVD